MSIQLLGGITYITDFLPGVVPRYGNSPPNQRLYALSTWRETPFFTDRERAALEWTEHLTLLSTKGISDELFARVREHFSEEEMLHLTLAVVQINSWNRLVITARVPVGSYQPGQFARHW